MAASGVTVFEQNKEQLPQPKPPKDKVLLDERGLLDLPFLALTVLLVLIGVIMMFSASYARAYQEKGISTYYFARQAVFAVLGIAGMLFVSRLNYQMWRFASFIVLGVSVFFLLLVPFIGEASHGAKRWITVAGIRFQPSELGEGRHCHVLRVAHVDLPREDADVQIWHPALRAHPRGDLRPCRARAAFFLHPHHACARRGHDVPRRRAPALVHHRRRGCRGVRRNLSCAHGYAGDRVTAWRDPASDPTDTGYQILQSLYAIGSGGLMGLGLGKGRQKYLYLPEEHNDYIFPIVCEELGFIGAMVVILLFVLLILRGYWIAMHARDRFGALMTAGLTTHLALQVFLNIGVVTNFLPATGISLPFFSYGGTALLIQLFEMGLILAVSRQNDNKLL